MKKRNKKKGFKRSRLAQISVFIIIAVVLVGAVAFLFTMLYKPGNENCGENGLCTLPNSGELGSIKMQITDCEKETTTDALKTIGIQGGFYNKPKYFHSIDWAFIPYYYYSGEDIMPQKINVQEELSSYVNDNMNDCLGKVNSGNYQINYEAPETMTAISPGKTVFTINSPITLKKGEETTKIELKQIPMIYNSSLYYILEVADYITRTHKENPELVCINCVVDMARERNLYVDMMEYPNLDKTTLVMISENYTSNEPYIFEFLNKY